MTPCADTAAPPRAAPTGDGAARQAWADAMLAAALVATDPAGLGGAALRARHGPVRTAWLAALAKILPEDIPLRRVPPGVADDRLLGGLDLPATLSAGRAVLRRGLLEEADGGLLLLPMAERAEPGLVGRLAAVLDTGRVRAEREGLSVDAPARVGLVALDESEEEGGGVPAALADRLAFGLDLDGVPAGAVGPAPFGPVDIRAARAALGGIAPDTDGETALATAGAAFGIASLRPVLMAVRAARALRALHGAAMESATAAEIAARLVLAPRATRLPPEETEAEAEPDAETGPDPESAEPPPPADGADAEERPDPGPPDEMPERVLEAIRAALPDALLAGLEAKGAATGPPRGTGKAGAERRTPDRGRPLAPRPGTPGGRARLDLVGTLRAAAPWQGLRRTEAGGAEPGPPVRLAPSDFRIRRFRRRSATTTIFVVDASGSAALARLAEAKGAVEIMLAEAYVRRDEVALVAFRGRGAEVLLPPTRAPAAARRRLAGLPGGGGTPVAAGLAAARGLADRVRADGAEPFLVVLTDGGANIALDGAAGRPAARADAETAARAIAAAGHAALVIDTGARAKPEVAELAAAMRARYLPMPRADAARLSRAARAAAPGGG